MLAAAALHAPVEHDVPQDIRWMNLATTALVVLAVAMVLTWGAVTVSRLAYFDLRHVEIEGDFHRHNLMTVRANAVPRLQGGYFSVDLREARAAFEALPWVRKAVVRRVWPDTLRVTLEEHRPAAYWHHDARDDELVNTFGEVFEANLGDVEDEGLPTLQAPSQAASTQAVWMLDMLRRLTPVLASLGEIRTLRLNDRGGWTVWLDDEARIELGRGATDDVVARTERFVRSYPVLVKTYAAPLLYADLRYAEGYAIKLQGLHTMPEPTPGQPRRPWRPVPPAQPSAPSTR